MRRPAITPARALLGLLIGAQVAYGRVPLRRPERAVRGLVGLMLATSLAEAAEARGARRGVVPVAAAGAIGFAAELAGVATGKPFGHYTYSAKLGPRVGGVPLLAAAAWAMMARPAWVVAGRISPRPAARVPLAAGALTAWDVFLDPRMARDGFWSWPGGGRYAGVPATNFAGWFVTGLGVFSAYGLIERERGDGSARGDGASSRGDGLDARRRRGAARDGGAVALYVWTWLGETFANAVLWRRPSVAAAGAAAMGAFAVPALLRGR